MSAPTWRIVIVNYRTGELAAAAAESALNAVEDRGEVIVIDSASGDNSGDLIREVKRARLIVMPENRGFGAALNTGAQGADCGYLLCQNADITYTSDLLYRLEQRFAAIESLAIAGPRLIGPDGLEQPSCRHFPTHSSLLFSRGSPLGAVFKSRQRRYIIPEPPSFTLCDVIAGACFAVHRPAWERLGGMDEEFFLYAEDTDFCRRAKSAGYLIGYEPAATATHIWGASTGQNRKQSARLHSESLARYFRKHHPDRPIANSLLNIALKLSAHR